MSTQSQSIERMLSSTENVIWSGSTSILGVAGWMRWHLTGAALALAAAAGVEPIPSVTWWVIETFFGGFALEGHQEGVDLGIGFVAVLLKSTLVIWAVLNLYAALTLIIKKSAEKIIVTGDRILSTSAFEIASIRLQDVTRVSEEAAGGAACIRLTVPGRDDFIMIGVEDHRNAVIAIQQGIAMTKRSI